MLGQKTSLDDFHFFQRLVSISKPTHSQTHARLQMRDVRHLEYLVFSSAGSHGFLYEGVLQALEDNVPGWLATVRGVAGTSAGAIAALEVALAMNRTQRETMLMCLSDMSHILRHADMTLLLHHYGLDDGTGLRQLVGEILTAGGLSALTTMSDLRRLLKVDVVFVAHDLLKCMPVHLSCATTPEMLVVDAVFASCSLPFIFTPFRFGSTLLCDGALSERVPDVFAESSTLFVVVPSNTAAVAVTSWRDMMLCFKNLCIASQQQRLARLLGLPNTICAFHPYLHQVPILDMHMDTRRAMTMLHLGYAIGIAYLYDTISHVLDDAVHKYVDAITLGTASSPESEDECGADRDG